MSNPYDHDPAAFDKELANAQVHVEAGNPAVEVTVAVPVSASTLTALTERAACEGRDGEAGIADAMRSAA